MADQDQKANIASLNNAAIAVIGYLAATGLKADGVVTLQVGDSGNIELVPVGELELDQLPEQEALQELIGRNYADAQLADYLRQRAHRSAWKQFRHQMEAQMELQKRLVEAQSLDKDEHR